VDLVVGADGAWSLVRHLVSPAKPIYSGIVFIDLTISDVDTRCPAVSNLVGQGTTFITSEGKSIIAQRNSRGRVRVCVSLRVDEGWLEEFEGGILLQADSEHARLVIISLFPGWAPELLDTVRFSDPPSLVRSMHSPPRIRGRIDLDSRFLAMPRTSCHRLRGKS
jgi:2-polyprenyl-6-methoxyphenol hydroxylase-like FAD-dependent oxidoreductase